MPDCQFSVQFHINYQSTILHFYTTLHTLMNTQLHRKTNYKTTMKEKIKDITNLYLEITDQGGPLYVDKLIKRELPPDKTKKL